jgi:hypothetical protein
MFTNPKLVTRGTFNNNLSWVVIPTGKKTFSQFRNFQTGSGTYPASHPVSAGVLGREISHSPSFIANNTTLLPMCFHRVWTANIYRLLVEIHIEVTVSVTSDGAW